MQILIYLSNETSIANSYGGGLLSMDEVDERAKHFLFHLYKGESILPVSRKFILNWNTPSTKEGEDDMSPRKVNRSSWVCKK